MALGRRNKLRLYVLFQHRNGKPGFHWSIQVAHKNEDSKHRSVLYDATNTIDVGYEDGRWRHRVRKDIDILPLGNVVARVLVAKLPVEARKEDHLQLLDEQFSEVPVVQDDPQWRCHSWVKTAVETLRSIGGAFTTVPAESVVEAEGVSFAKDALQKLMKREISISSHSEIPVKDIRIRSTSGTKG